MKRSPEEFQTAILDLIEEMRYRTPTVYDEFRRTHLTREGARVYALEHCVFAANFPRWLANIAGNCPHLDVRKYLIENMYVEEVHDPTIEIGHYESMVDFTVALGIERQYIYGYTGAQITKLRIVYCDWVSRTLPWLEAFAAIAGNEIARGKEMIKRVGDRARTSRRQWAALNLSEDALSHWDAADAADSEEGGHGDVPLDILKKYADTEEKQDVCLRAMRERQLTNRIWFDQIGLWAYEASGLTPPPLVHREPLPAPVMA
jgi:pyrroloquinoline quinone (PQQ) biosynthesis protein C